MFGVQLSATETVAGATDADDPDVETVGVTVVGALEHAARPKARAAIRTERNFLGVGTR